METRIATSIEQSKKLIELGIDVNTADMDYIPFANDPKNYDCVINYWNNEHEDDWIPAWSLSALLELLFQPSLHNTAFGYWRCDYYKGQCWTFGDLADDPVDAVFNSVVSLLENKKI